MMAVDDERMEMVVTARNLVSARYVRMFRIERVMGMLDLIGIIGRRKSRGHNERGNAITASAANARPTFAPSQPATGYVRSQQACDSAKCAANSAGRSSVATSAARGGWRGLRINGDAFQASRGAAGTELAEENMPPARTL